MLLGHLLTLSHTPIFSVSPHIHATIQPIHIHPHMCRAMCSSLLSDPQNIFTWWDKGTISCFLTPHTWFSGILTWVVMATSDGVLDLLLDANRNRSGKNAFNLCKVWNSFKLGPNILCVGSIWHVWLFGNCRGKKKIQKLLKRGLSLKVRRKVHQWPGTRRNLAF